MISLYVIILVAENDKKIIWIRKAKLIKAHNVFLIQIISIFPHVNSRNEISARAEITTTTTSSSGNPG